MKRAADDLIVEPSKNVCVGIVSSGQRLTAGHVVMNVADAPDTYVRKTQGVDADGDHSEGLSRAIFIVDGYVIWKRMRLALS